MDKKEALNLFATVVGVEENDILKDLDAVSMLIAKQKGEYVFFEGDKGEDLYFILKGAVRLFKTSYDGREITLHIAEKDDIFAEIVLFLENRYPASAVALEDTLLLSINSHKLFEKISQNPTIAMKLLGAFAKRINFLAERVKQLSIEDAKERVMEYLEKNADSSNTVKLSLPKKEIATMLGVTPETFSRVIKKLKEDGVLTINGKNLRIVK